ncbi:unnamed protein product [Paramecium sonneborni]|uniref:MORN repeat protein n=1 Tax=Paramecium sonneborni TaxID=65129 RepID=A0A8S1NR16_9CILI|nr:unnamed protein product [Paramecium sonneborni]
MEGEFGKVKKKSGKWRAFWSGLVYKEVGGYYDNGLKQGLWSEFIKNYSRKAQICENGYYLNDQKQGKWNYIYKNNIIGWGLYNQLAEKQGKWIELSDGFSNYSQVTYNGEYQNGKKAGRWDILFRDQRQYRFQQIGGGLYNAGVKVGMWIELSDGFQIYSKVTFQGIYKNGNKVGKWDIKIYKFDGKSNCSGGFYKEVEGCYTKMGKWIEQGYGLNLYSQVILEGEYKNGRKLVNWIFCIIRNKEMFRN